MNRCSSCRSRCPAPQACEQAEPAAPPSLLLPALCWAAVAVAAVAAALLSPGAMP